MSAVWDNYLTERDKEVLALTGYGRPGGFGKRPALVIIDVNYDFVGEEPVDIIEAVQTSRNSAGKEGWAAVHQIARVLKVAREKQIPIFYSNILRRPDNWDSGGWKWKNTRNKEQAYTPGTQRKGNEFPPEIAPQEHEFVIWKQRPSIFFGTTMITHLIELGVDTVIFCGGTTSGCVRASVLDAFSYNLRSIVVEDGCFDRFQLSHAANLFDLNAKYSDVMPAGKVVEHLNKIEKNLYPDLPKGKDSGK